MNWKLKTTFDLVVSSGVIKIGLNYNGLPDRSDLQAIIAKVDAAGTALDYQPFTETLGNTLLSQMRCAGIALQYFPSFPNGSIQLGNGYFPCVIMSDRDGIETTLATTTFDSLMSQVHRSKVKNLYRPWRTFHKTIKYGLYNRTPISNQSGGLEPNQNLWGLWHGTDNNHGIGSVTAAYGAHTMVIGKALNTTDFPDGTVIGTIIATAYLQYKDRQ